MLVSRSFLHYWRWHIALAIGTALAAMAILGSLFVGDSVKATLKFRAEQRLQGITHAVSCGDGFLSLAAVQRVQQQLPGRTVAPVLMLPGTISLAEGGKRVNGVNVYGVDASFWGLASQPTAPPPALAVNKALADRLGVTTGAEIILRVEKPSLISRDAPLSGESEATVAISEAISAIVAPEHLGALNLAAEQTDALNVFLPLTQMAKSVEAVRLVNGEPLANVNLLLANTDGVENALRQAGGWQLEDVGMELFSEPTGGHWVLKSGRVFLADQVTQAAVDAGLQPQSVFTYLATDLRADANRYTAYPLVTGVAAEPKVLDKPLSGDEMAISQWTADSLKLGVGDTVSLNYYSVTEARSLQEKTAQFKIREVLPMTHPLLNGALTPDFPGFSQAANCRDWKAGIPIKQQGFIRMEDEAYWKERKGTPKAFISLAKAEALWKNRFGKATSLWMPSQQGTAEQVRGKLQSALTLNDLGFVFVPTQAQAKAAVDGSMDFGGLFLAMSFFLIATALVLVALLFHYNIESRAGQIGVLRASGFTASRVRNLYLKEFGLTLVLGALLGIPLAKLYQTGILSRLSGEWGGAVNGLQFLPVQSPMTILNGLGMTICIGLAVLWWASRKLAMAEPARLVAGGGLVAEPTMVGKKGRSTWSFWMGVLMVVIAAGMAPQAGKLERHLQPGLFFGAASLLLVGGLLLISDWLRGLESRQTAAPASTWGLGIRQAVRRRGRSLAVAGLLASGVFMVASMNTMHTDARKTENPGTGGFAFIANGDTPIYEDLNSKAGQEQYGLESVPASFIPLRKRQGEEASCLNLNKAQVPSVLGVAAQKIAIDGKFPFAGTWSGMDNQGIRSPWELLDRKLPDGAIPAIVDLNSAMWALKKKLGDIVEVPNGLGGTAKLQLVAFLKNTVMQGHVIISEAQFSEQFPDTAGYKLFLVNAPVDGRDAVASKLTRQLQTKGFALQTTENRLAELQAVQNAYLNIFSALGGLGLLLSTAALGLLIGRNVLERQGELALLTAAGFTKKKIRQIVLAEFLPLFGIAFLLGIAAAGLAIWPHLRDGSGAIPLQLLRQVLGGMAVAGIGFCVAATWLALRKQTLLALRQE